MAAGHPISLGRLTVEIFVLVVIGTPLVAYLWETLNRLLSGTVEPVRLAISAPLLVLFVILLRALRHAIARWERQREESIDRPDEGDRA